MTEYWKASPNYWCKHCACYVRDTKLERQNHEATAKHQNAIKRSLRDLHRNHEREEREKERARREIDRLNGVVTSSSSGPSRPGRASAPAGASESSLKKQREQLAELGVAVPDDFRGEMAMPGEWTVTSTRVVESAGEGADEEKKARVATGVRKREDREEDREEEDAVKGLFKKPRRWGRDSKNMPEGEDEELDALLSGTVRLKGEEGVKEEVKEEVKEGVKKEDDIKGEPDTATSGIHDGVVKGEEEDGGAKVKVEEEAGDSGLAPVVFKKRKPKGLRTK